jgi:hypothetical protein
MMAEVGEIERSLLDSVSEAANLSKFALETGSSLSELEKYIQQFLNLQEKLVVYSDEQSADTEMTFQNFTVLVDEAENAVKNLKESEMQISQIMTAMEVLQVAVADFKTSGNALEKDTVNNLMADYNLEIYT